MSEKSDKALALRAQGYNCAQAVLCALTDEQMACAASGFGGGMGNQQATCGAVIGAVMALGVNTGARTTVPLARQIQEGFVSRCGALQCRALKGGDTGKVLCACPDCVKNAVLAYEQVMEGIDK